jgi:hypothetical protein
MAHPRPRFHHREAQLERRGLVPLADNVKEGEGGPAEERVEEELRRGWVDSLPLREALDRSYGSKFI